MPRPQGRQRPCLSYERILAALGYARVAGVDEAGRGPLAGPVVAAAVVLPLSGDLEGVDDSKRLSPAQREDLYHRILAEALDVGVGMANREEIDRLNILGATRMAMARAVARLKHRPDFLLVDGHLLPHLPIPGRAVPRGDRICTSIAAASIVAKVTRDRLMADYHRQYPHYGFLRHKGYPTREHLEQLRRHGPSPIHRRSFRGVLPAGPEG